jgi:hypothetical protein
LPISRCAASAALLPRWTTGSCKTLG